MVCPKIDMYEVTPAYWWIKLIHRLPQPAYPRCSATRLSARHLNEPNEIAGRRRILKYDAARKAPAEAERVVPNGCRTTFYPAFARKRIDRR